MGPLEGAGPIPFAATRPFGPGGLGQVGPLGPGGLGQIGPLGPSGLGQVGPIGPVGPIGAAGPLLGQNSFPNYQFSYGVQADGYQGAANFGHDEQRNGYSTTGQYFVDLPGSSYQKVSYNVGAPVPY